MIPIELFRNKSGLEIAGPSEIFKVGGPVPIYDEAEKIDDFSFNRPLRWGGRKLNPGKTFQYHPDKLSGEQFVGDATDLASIPEETYDFVIASHVIEHIANPIKAAVGWLRALRPSGILLIVAPHLDTTFDRHRPRTSLCHLLLDYTSGTREDDQTHFAEVKHLSTKHFPDAWFTSSSLHRGLHHHVFDTRLLIEFFSFLQLEVVGLELLLPHHIILAGRKAPHGVQRISDEPGFSYLHILRASPFPSDRIPRT